MPALGCKKRCNRNHRGDVTAIIIVPIWRLGVTVPDRLVIIDKDLRCVRLRVAGRACCRAEGWSGWSTQRAPVRDALALPAVLAVPGLLALFIRRAYMPTNQHAGRTLYASACVY